MRVLKGRLPVTGAATRALGCEITSPIPAVVWANLLAMAMSVIPALKIAGGLCRVCGASGQVPCDSGCDPGLTGSRAITGAGRA